MRWIKASERLPEIDYVFVRNIQTKSGGMIHRLDLLKMSEHENVEWLDETPPAPVRSVEDVLRDIYDEHDTQEDNLQLAVTLNPSLEKIYAAMQAYASQQPIKEGGEAVEFPPIPDWIIKYDKANHQSSAGKAIRILMQRIKEMEPVLKNQTTTT